MCHEFQRGRCPHAKDEYFYCERGWHVTQKQHEKRHATKRTLPTRYADDSRVDKRHRNKCTTEAAIEKKECRDREKKWLDLEIYLTRLGFYNIPTLPHPDEIESAYRNAMDEELPQEEKTRKQDAFEQIMRAINGHIVDEDSELDEP